MTARQDVGRITLTVLFIGGLTGRQLLGNAAVLARNPLGNHQHRSTNVDLIGDLVRSVLSLRVPPPPEELAQIPLVGKPAADTWNRLNIGRSSRVDVKAQALRGSADAVVRIRGRKPRQHAVSVFTDDSHRCGHVCGR